MSYRQQWDESNFRYARRDPAPHLPFEDEGPSFHHFVSEFGKYLIKLIVLALLGIMLGASLGVYGKAEAAATRPTITVPDGPLPWPTTVKAAETCRTFSGPLFSYTLCKPAKITRV